MTVEQLSQAIEWSVMFLMLALVWALPLFVVALVVGLVWSDWRNNR